jgi:hypothetical protein
MKRAIFCCALACSLAVASAARAESDDEVKARETALSLAGAFSNDGFRIRDGHLSGLLQPNETRCVAVNLYAGNQYWFSLGGTEKLKKASVRIYDEAGNRLKTESFDRPEQSAAGFSPQSSGQYFVALNLLEGEAGSVCLVYSYK